MEGREEERAGKEEGRGHGRKANAEDAAATGAGAGTGEGGTPTLPDTTTAPLEGPALEDAIQQQMEYLLSRDHLAFDPYLASQMNAEMYIPITVLAPLCTAPVSDTSIIADVLRRKSTILTVNESGTHVKPNIKVVRNTLILRDISSTADAEKVRAIFAGEHCPTVISLRPDIGNCWFVTFEGADEALQALLHARSQQFEGSPVKARIKSENLLRNLYYPDGDESQKEANDGIGTAGMNTNAYYSGFAHHAPRGTYARPAHISDADKDRRVHNNSGNSASGPTASRQRKDIRKPASGQQGLGANILGTSRNVNNTGAVVPGANTANSSRGRRGGPRSGRNNNLPANTSPSFPTKSATAQLQLGLAHFPPLGPHKGLAQNVGYTKEFIKYDKNDLIGLVEAVDMSKQIGAPFAAPVNCPIVLGSPITKLLIVPNQRVEDASQKAVPDTTAKLLQETPIAAWVVQEGAPHPAANPEPVPVSQQKKRRQEKKRPGKVALPAPASTPVPASVPTTDNTKPVEDQSAVQTPAPAIPVSLGSPPRVPSPSVIPSSPTYAQITRAIQDTTAH